MNESCGWASRSLNTALAGSTRNCEEGPKIQADAKKKHKAFYNTENYLKTIM